MATGKPKKRLVSERKKRIERAKAREMYLGLTIVVLILIGIGAAGWYFLALPKGGQAGVGPVGSAHIHADFKLYINNVVWDFSQERYQLRSRHVHFEDGNGWVIHVHATGVTMGFFFQTLGMKFNSTCLVTDDGEEYCNQGDKTLKFYVNGKKNGDYDRYVIRDLDKILVSYGVETEEVVRRQIASITDEAKLHSREEVPTLGPAPDFTLQSIDGRQFSLRDFRGKVVVLWFMASWCPTCAGQAQTLKRIQSDFGDELVIVAINLWVPEVIGGQEAQGIPAVTVDELKVFRDRFGSPKWIWAQDTDRVTFRYRITSVDSTVVIDGNGNIIFRYSGPTGYERLADIIKKALGK